MVHAGFNANIAFLVTIPAALGGEFPVPFNVTTTFGRAAMLVRKSARIWSTEDCVRLFVCKLNTVIAVAVAMY